MFFMHALQTVKLDSNYLEKYDRSVGDFMENALSWIRHLTMLYPILCYTGPHYNRGLLYIDILKVLKVTIFIPLD